MSNDDFKPSIDDGKKTSSSKRKSAEQFVRDVKKRSDVKNKEFPFYIALTMANIELIWCDESEGNDAYTHPIYLHIQNRTDWMVQNRFAGVYSWRQNKQNNETKYNSASTKSAYPRRYYLRIMDPNESTHQSRYEILQKCAQVCCYVVTNM